MKNLAKSVLLIALPLILLFACKKDEDKVVFKNGAAPALVSSVTTLALVESDSAKQGVKLTWSNPNYAFNNVGSSLKVGYTVEIDSTGKNFAKPQVISLTDVLEKTYTVAEFNQLLIKIGLKTGVQGSVDVRVTSALYVASSKVVSNTVTMKVTPYNVKPKPVIPPPAKLYITGDATAGGWSDNPPAPQEFTQIDENTFGLILPLIGGKEYLLLPEKAWAHKYSLTSKTDPALKAGGKFLYDAPENFPGPTASGTYKIIVSFLTGEYTVTPVAPGSLPSNLFIVGDATPLGWTNDLPPLPAQPFTKKNDFTFELTIALTTGKNYLLLPVQGSWDHKFAVSDNTIPEAKLGGTFLVDTGKDFPSPAESGNYKIVVSFLNNSYKLTKL